jgi:L-lactate dehydrogenase complex protein LldF
MKAAGVLLAHPALYRAAIATADSALNNLPRFAIYNRFNAWGKHREVPHAPPESFHHWFKRTRSIP